MAQQRVPFAEYKYDNVLTDDIGGRSLDDAEQLALSISNTIRDYWPINEVPPNLPPKLKELVEMGQRFKLLAENLMREANQSARGR